ncbi:MAG: hypothetical protein MUC83_01500 [Pirellula sp.]|jgi:hypothetical protein|nr:hypothetical protein [Pirellula sp.]
MRLGLGGMAFGLLMLRGFYLASYAVTASRCDLLRPTIYDPAAASGPVPMEQSGRETLRVGRNTRLCEVTACIVPTQA